MMYSNLNHHAFKRLIVVIIRALENNMNKLDTFQALGTCSASCTEKVA